GAKKYRWTSPISEDAHNAMPTDVGGDFKAGLLQFGGNSRGSFFFVIGKFRVRVQFFVKIFEARIIRVNLRADQRVERSTWALSKAWAKERRCAHGKKNSEFSHRAFLKRLVRQTKSSSNSS